VIGQVDEGEADDIMTSYDILQQTDRYHTYTLLYHIYFHQLAVHVALSFIAIFGTSEYTIGIKSC
jgi:hypothetical protein